MSSRRMAVTILTLDCTDAGPTRIRTPATCPDTCSGNGNLIPARVVHHKQCEFIAQENEAAFTQVFLNDSTDPPLLNRDSGR